MCSDAFLQLKRDSRRQLCQREKRTLHGLDYPVACRCQLFCNFRSPPTGFGMLDRIPFPPLPAKPLDHRNGSAACKAFPRRFPSGVRPDLPMSKYCSHGNRLRFSLLCSPQNNRYYNQDLHWVHDSRRLASNASARAPRPPTQL